MASNASGGPFSTADTITPLTAGNREASATSEGHLLAGSRPQHMLEHVEVDDLPPVRTSRVGWAIPAVLLLFALFLQNAGLFLGTRCYVRWMDELAEPRPSLAAAGAADGAAPAKQISACGFDPASPLQNGTVLSDPLGEFVQSMRPGGFAGPWGAEFWVDFLSSAVSYLWLAWIACTRDLRLWTKVFLAGAVLACLKGFLAWATVLPDAAGWDTCRQRLGPDGLLYYRGLSSVGANEEQVGTIQGLVDVLVDIGMMELRGLWMMGRTGWQEACRCSGQGQVEGAAGGLGASLFSACASTCADTTFSAPTYLCALFAMSLFDAIRASAEPLDWSWRKRTWVLFLAGALLLAVVLADLFVTVAMAHHYTVDVMVALPLALMVYGSPAIAVSAERWSKFCELPEEGVSATDLETAVQREGSDSIAIKDLGHTTIPPCCVPCFGGLYYLREQPVMQRRPPWDEEAKKRYVRQVSEFTQIRERDAGRLRQVGDALDEERRRAQQKSAEAQLVAQQAERQMQAKEQQLRQDEERLLAEADARAEKDRLLRAGLEERASAEVRRTEQAEADFRDRFAQLQSAAATARKEAQEAKEASARHQATSQKFREEAQTLLTLLGRLQAEGAAEAGGGHEKQVA